VVNLDPANDALPYPCAVDVTELITLEDVMEEYTLGPNGGVIFCIEYLVQNLTWLMDKLETIKGGYCRWDYSQQDPPTNSPLRRSLHLV
jgi:hypothetical protein